MSLYKPDYGGGSIVNLMSAIVEAFGGESRYAPLAASSLGQVKEATNVVLLVLDGLGYEYLASRGGSTRLYSHARERLTSVFPTTTATAITSFLTGAAPQQHAITGWFMYLRELGAVSAILPFRMRAGGCQLDRNGFGPREIIGAASLFVDLDVPSYLVSDERIVDSAFSVASSGVANRIAYRDLNGFFESIRSTVGETGERKYIYGYWPGFDALAHQYGIESQEVYDHLQAIDRGFDWLVRRLGGTDTKLIVTADHGLIDTSPDKTVYLADHPELEGTLALPLCGEPRTAYCYVRPDKVETFSRYVTSHLRHCCEVHASEDLIHGNYFGWFEPHPRLADRVGDYVLIMKENYILKDSLPGEGEFHQIGVHGGLSPDELYVPLIVADL